jgi:iron-sulfur cluster assembly protein
MEQELINITEKALQQIRAIRTPEQADAGLRLAVVGGGCSGLSYKIEFSAAKDKDNVMSFIRLTLTRLLNSQIKAW